MQGNKPGKKRRKNPNQSGDNLCKETNQAKKKKKKPANKKTQTNPMIIFCKKKKTKQNKTNPVIIFCQRHIQTQSQITTPLPPSKPKPLNPKPLKPNHKPTVATKNQTPKPKSTK